MAIDKKDKHTADFVQEDRTIYNAGQALQLKRARVTKNCEICDDEFVGYTNRLTCSDKCRKTKSRIND